MNYNQNQTLNNTERLLAKSGDKLCYLSEIQNSKINDKFKTEA